MNIGSMLAAVFAPVETIATLGAVAGSGGLEALEARKARKLAERLAAEERDRLAALQALDPPTIPDPEAVRRGERRRSITSQMRRRGRASTILTNTDSDVLGA
jgi:hypothetical protein